LHPDHIAIASLTCLFYICSHKRMQAGDAPEVSNEAQHPFKVLAWHDIIDGLTLRRDPRLPAYRAKDIGCAGSRRRLL